MRTNGAQFGGDTHKNLVKKMNKTTHNSASQSDIPIETQEIMLPQEGLAILTNSPSFEQIIESLQRLSFYFSTNEFKLEDESNVKIIEIIMSIITSFSDESNYNETIILQSFNCLNQILVSIKILQNKNEISEEQQSNINELLNMLSEFILSYCEDNLDNNSTFSAINLISCMIRNFYDNIVNSRLIDILISVLEHEATDENEAILEESVLNCFTELLNAFVNNNVIFDEVVIKLIPFFISIIPKKIDLNNPLLLKYLSLIELISTKIVVARRQILQNQVHIALIEFFNEIPLEGKETKKLMASLTSILAVLSMEQPDIASMLNYEKLFQCLSSNNANVSQDSCTLLCQIILNNPDVAGSLIEMGLIDCLLQMMQAGKTISKQSGLKIICQIAKIGNADFDKIIVESGLLEHTIENLQNEDNVLILNLSLQTLFEIISHEKEINYDVKSYILDNGGDEALGLLTSNEDELISTTASQILDSYLLAD